MTTLLDTPARALAGWSDVVSEQVRSSTARAAEGTLYKAPGVVGVLSGAAPLVWVYGDADAAAVAVTVANAPEVVEVHVHAGDVATTRLLEATGWRTESLVTQLVHPGAGPAGDTPPGYTVAELTVADLPEFRALLSSAAGASGALLAACYGDDFFVRAAPAWLFGARDASGALAGIVGVRRQHRSAMLFALGVAEGHRGSGIGRALVEAAVACGHEAGAEFCHAVAEPDAVALAASCGFVRVGGWRRLTR